MVETKLTIIPNLKSFFNIAMTIGVTAVYVRMSENPVNCDIRAKTSTQAERTPPKTISPVGNLFFLVSAVICLPSFKIFHL